MGKALTKYALRMQKQAQREATIRKVFQATAKTLEQAKRDRNQKKKTHAQISQLICEKGVMHRNIREPYEFKPCSHNLSKQIIGYIDHLYVRYKAPRFLYQAFFDDPSDPFNCMRDIYRKWFVSIAQGLSFAKLTKGVMTSKEASMFLDAPVGNKVHENVWWAKLNVAGVPPAVRDRLIAKILTNYFFDDPANRFAELISFFANYHSQFEEKQLNKMLDFLAWKLLNDSSFRLKGRTASSVGRMSAEWHRMIRKARLGSFIQWQGASFGVAQFETFSNFVEISQLYDNQQLMIEGMKQKHCVYTYVPDCTRGESAIFSMRIYGRVFVGYDRTMMPRWEKTRETTRITIEVSPGDREVVQVRGPLNGAASAEEKRWIRLWAHSNKLTVVEYCWGWR